MSVCGQPLTGALVFAVHRVLHIVHASVFPHILSIFITLPIFMVLEKAADVILEAAT